MNTRRLAFGVMLALCLAVTDLASAQVAQVVAKPVSVDDVEAFMRSAKVVRRREMSVGITRPLRLTLSNGTISHDAVFQAIDERRAIFTPVRGRTEFNFVDSWRYNVAAYRLAQLVGLDWMMPVTIEYSYQGKIGSLSWWMDSIMDERRRLKEKVQPPDVTAWNRDMYRMRVFAQLVHDTDRNLTNVLISPEWRVIMLDFTRAFRLHGDVEAKEIHQCDRQLFEALQALTPEVVKEAVGEYLTGLEADAVLNRRDQLVAHIKALIAERGEDKVLY